MRIATTLCIRLKCFQKFLPITYALYLTYLLLAMFVLIHAHNIALKDDSVNILMTKFMDALLQYFNKP